MLQSLLTHLVSPHSPEPFSFVPSPVPEAPLTRCLVVSDNAMHRITLEHYVALSGGLRLVASLCDGVEAYDYLQRGGEVDLVILDLSSAGLHPDDIRSVTHGGRPRWLMIEQMGNIPSFSGQAPADGRLPQPLCFSRFGQLVGQVLGQRPATA
ncbi:hypothetical protein [uncultured Hymenobacter sp.]|uniref:hypothetical protein n=1 Tax=uncultured Hymenobacter sp. TaxID=170016 RepID=UPI0035CB2499